MFLIERAIVSSGQSANAAYSSRVNPGLLLYRSRAASKGNYSGINMRIQSLLKRSENLLRSNW